MKLYAGIDLHANNSVVVVIDEEDRILYQKRLRNELTELLQALTPYQETLQGDCRRIDLQLVLVSRWTHGHGVSRAFGEHDRD